MSRQLLIMRHAKSDWHSGISKDFDRPLNKRGKEAAPKMARWLSQQELIPDFVISSPAKRAEQTVQRVCQELALKEKNIVWEPRIYEASVATLCQVLSECPATAQQVLLIGHNPGLEDLVVYLCGEIPETEDNNIMPTATIAHLQMPSDWTQLNAGCGRLVSLTRPRSLAD